MSKIVNTQAKLKLFHSQIHHQKFIRWIDWKEILFGIFAQKVVQVYALLTKSSKFTLCCMTSNLDAAQLMLETPYPPVTGNSWRTYYEH